MEPPLSPTLKCVLVLRGHVVAFGRWLGAFDVHLMAVCSHMTAGEGASTAVWVCGVGAHTDGGL